MSNTETNYKEGYERMPDESPKGSPEKDNGEAFEEMPEVPPTRPLGTLSRQIARALEFEEHDFSKPAQHVLEWEATTCPFDLANGRRLGSGKDTQADHQISWRLRAPRGTTQPGGYADGLEGKAVSDRTTTTPAAVDPGPPRRRLRLSITLRAVSGLR